MGLMITFKQFIFENGIPAIYNHWSGVGVNNKPFFKKYFEQAINKDLDKTAIPYFLNYAKHESFNYITVSIVEVDGVNSKEGDYMSQNMAYKALLDTCYVVYEMEYEFNIEFFLSNGYKKLSAIQMRNLIVNQVWENIFQVYNEFMKDTESLQYKDFNVYLKQQLVKDAISKNNTSGWEL